MHVEGRRYQNIHNFNQFLTNTFREQKEQKDFADTTTMKRPKSAAKRVIGRGAVEGPTGEGPTGTQREGPRGGE